MSQTSNTSHYETLFRLICEHSSETDKDTVHVVASVAGLLASVAYADRNYTTAEQEHLCQELARVRILNESGVGAICELFQEHIPQISSTVSHTCARNLREHCEKEQLREVLQVLIDLAAVDDELSLAETNQLRRLADALGLDQADYNDAQARHKDKLTVLKSRDAT